MPTEARPAQLSDKDQFKIFASIISDSKTFPTAAERSVHDTPYITKKGNFFNMAITLIDRAFYKPSNSNTRESISPIAETAHEYKAYTNYKIIDNTINEVEDFFDDARYDLNLGNVSVTKNLNPGLQVSANVDFIGNLGAGFKKELGGTYLGGAVQYKPAQNEGRLNLSFTNNVDNASTSIYINNYNPGVLTNYTRQLDTDKYVGVGAAIFKENSNMYVKYKHNKNVSFSAYGSLKSPYVGVSGVVIF